MAFRTYQEGLKIATDNANKAISTESSLSSLGPLTSPLPTLQKAFRQYITSAESYSLLTSSALVPAGEKAGLQRKWKLVLDRADKVKKKIEDLGGAVGKVELGDEGVESAIVRRGGVVHGVSTSAWGTPGAREWTSPAEFKSGMQPELAKEQIAMAPTWTPLPASAWKETKKEERWVVKQGVGADCSVVAGLSVLMEHDRKWNTSLALGCLYPQAMTGQPRHSENGKHIVKLLLNGTWRGVVIDALLPHSSKTHEALYPHAIQRSPSLHSSSSFSSSTEPGSAAIPLLLKAYFLTHGGYALRGSNPAPDIYALTGWIPERISFREGFQREKEWNRILKAYQTGNVLVTLGSGKARELVDYHAYAVLDVREEKTERVLEVYDPGLPSSPASDVPSIIVNGEGMDDLTLVERKQGVFRMTWDEVCSDFDSLNLNWNPTRMPVQVTRHWSWAKPPTSDESSSDLTGSPRYRLRVDGASTSGDDEIWILLSQHVHSRDNPIDDIALHVFPEFDSGRRGSAMAGAHILGDINPYANGQHILVRVPLRHSSSSFLVLPSRDRGWRKTDFTIRIVSSPNTTVSLDRISRDLPFTTRLSGSLSSRNAGGSPNWPTYSGNPQYRLVVPRPPTGPRGEPVALKLAVRGDKDVAWGVKVLWGKGEIVTEYVSSSFLHGDKMRSAKISLSQDAIVADSGAYSYGLAYAETASLEPGTYTLILSAFEPAQTGDWVLELESTASVTLSPIPPEGAGMYARSIESRWSESNAGGRPSGGGYDRNPHVDVILPVAGTLMARLHHPVPSVPPIPLNLTLFERGEGGAVGAQIATSGPYNDGVGGVRVGKTKVEKGVYVLVPSAYEPGAGKGEGWRVDVWSDVQLSVELVK